MMAQYCFIRVGECSIGSIMGIEVYFLMKAF